RRRPRCAAARARALSCNIPPLRFTTDNPNTTEVDPMNSNATAPDAGDAATPAAALALQAVYLKDCSFEAPLGPRANGEWNPQISLDLNTSVQPINGDVREVVLTVTVSAKQGEQTLFLVEVKQAGAFLIQNLAGEEYK